VKRGFLMRSFLASVCQIVAVLLFVAAAWVWCVPAFIFSVAVVFGAVGVLIDSDR